MMLSPLARALSQRPDAELREMLQRARFEIEVIEEALSNESPPAESLSPREVRERVLRIIEELGPVPPKPIRDAINDESINVYNALNQLIKEGRLTRENSLYSLPKTSPEPPRREGEDP
jgi:hypothetical protein